MAQRIDETIGWLLREMVTDGGAFASSLDADSEGEEGKFYVWSRDEIEEVLGAEDTRAFADAYDVSREGNWEGKNILNRLNDLDLRKRDVEERLAEMRAKLLGAARQPHPSRFRRQGARRLERADDRRARQGG